MARRHASCRRQAVCRQSGPRITAGLVAESGWPPRGARGTRGPAALGRAAGGAGRLAIVPCLARHACWRSWRQEAPGAFGANVSVCVRSQRARGRVCRLRSRCSGPMRRARRWVGWVGCALSAPHVSLARLVDGRARSVPVCRCSSWLYTIDCQHAQKRAYHCILSVTSA